MHRAKGDRLVGASVLPVSDNEFCLKMELNNGEIIQPNEYNRF